MIANDEILNRVCCDHRSETPSAVLPHIAIRPTSNSESLWVNSHGTSSWYYRKSSIKPLGGPIYFKPI